MTPSPIRSFKSAYFLRILTLVFTLVFPGLSMAQKNEITELNWKPVQIQEDGNSRISFDGAHYLPEFHQLPLYFKKLNTSGIDVSLSEAIYSTLSPEEVKIVHFDLTEDVDIKTIDATEKKQPFTLVYILPFRINPTTKQP